MQDSVHLKSPYCSHFIFSFKYWLLYCMRSRFWWWEKRLSFTLKVVSCSLEMGIFHPICVILRIWHCFDVINHQLTALISYLTPESLWHQNRFFSKAWFPKLNKSILDTELGVKGKGEKYDHALMGEHSWPTLHICGGKLGNLFNTRQSFLCNALCRALCDCQNQT